MLKYTWLGRTKNLSLPPYIEAARALRSKCYSQSPFAAF
jgi:hypothetical protein